MIGQGFCDQLRAARARVNGQIDDFRAAVIRSFPPGGPRDAVLAQLENARTQANTQIDQVLARVCQSPIA